MREPWSGSSVGFLYNEARQRRRVAALSFCEVHAETQQKHMFTDSTGPCGAGARQRWHRSCLITDEG
jgi:hypothetical protein